MITTVALSLAILGAPSAAPAKQTAAELVSKMLAYYQEANTISGTITLTASDGGGQRQLVTSLQYAKPSKLYIRQVKAGGTAMQWLVTSDGTEFSYDVPQDLPGYTFNEHSHRLVEPVLQLTGEYVGKTPVKAPYGVRQIYAAVAPSIGDRSVPLDVAIGRTEDLRHDNLTWMTVESGGKVTFNGAETNRVFGKWRPYGEASTDTVNSPGQYEMLIADDGKLVRYSTFQFIRSPGGTDVTLQLTWDVNLTLNGKPDDSLFKVIR